ncbi:MAG: hypothetical protein LUG91_00215 [Ruminococcus sp.]|nr:hypothetical protein [Ruminococcus sp.]
MRLDYGTLLSNSPIKLSMGNLRKPKLQEIADISFPRFGFYELLAKLTPKQYFNILLGEKGKALWEDISDEEKEKMSTYKLILSDEGLRDGYLEMINFFFEEKVIFSHDMFVFLDSEVVNVEEIQPQMIKGFINEDNFTQVMYTIQQICCIADKMQEDISEMKFKNDKARKIYEKILKAQREQKENLDKKANKDLSLPNIISAVSTKHPSLNLINVWNLTIFQLLDSFNRLQVNAMYDIDSARVSAWGDEKKTFDAALWYKNHNDD